MPFDTATVLTIIIGVAGVVITLVAPLYLLVLRGYGDTQVADEVRGDLAETQQQLQQDVSDIKDEVGVMHTEIRVNAERTEQNQQHIHQLLVGDHNGDGDDMGNPHYRAEYCPLPGECPYHAD